MMPLLFALLLLLNARPTSGAAASTLWFVCADTNDVWKVLANSSSSSSTNKRVRVNTVEEALKAANVAIDGMLVLADGTAYSSSTLFLVTRGGYTAGIFYSARGRILC